MPLPGLVWIGEGYGYSLWAVKDEWPGPGSHLYHAPTPNAWSDDKGVCHGNVPFPAASAATIWQSVEMFFGSTFNNHLAGGKSYKHSDNILDMWRELNRAGAGEYPAGDLVDAWITLREVASK